MQLSPAARALVKLAAALGLAFIWLPLLLVVVLAFNTSKTFSWPPEGFTTAWWSKAWGNDAAREALLHSVEVAALATAVALVLGTLASFAVQRHRFFGRETISFLVILPIALPGIVTGIALNAAFQRLGVELGYLSIVVAHATFCIVVVYNNVIARLRRMQGSLEEASADLGADPITTFRLVTFPIARSALLAGGLLAFGLSFDEIVVTTFTARPGFDTLPIWMFANFARPNQLPIVNVVAVVVILLSIIPVWLAQRISGGAAGVAAGGRS